MRSTRTKKNFSSLVTAATRPGCASALPRAEFTGVLRGEELSRAYANMDLFVFPSHTDTFGNVVLEALASGVPAIVTPDGGPCTIVRDGETGRIVPDDQFTPAIREILADPDRHAVMRQAARAYAAHRELGFGV
jgi:phosphatidylinositol alpha 1,6-mannosyltransferase